MNSSCSPLESSPLLRAPSASARLLTIVLLAMPADTQKRRGKIQLWSSFYSITTTDRVLFLSSYFHAAKGHVVTHKAYIILQVLQTINHSARSQYLWHTPSLLVSSPVLSCFKSYYHQKDDQKFQVTSVHCHPAFPFHEEGSMSCTVCGAHELKWKTRR